MMRSNFHYRKSRTKSSLIRVVKQIAEGFTVTEKRQQSINITESEQAKIICQTQASKKDLLESLKNQFKQACRQIIETLQQNPFNERSLDRSSLQSLGIEDSIRINKPPGIDHSYTRHLNNLECID